MTEDRVGEAARRVTFDYADLMGALQEGELGHARQATLDLDQATRRLRREIDTELNQQAGAQRAAG